MSQHMQDVGEVLVIKLGALGDVALSLPHIAKIVASCPQGRVTLLTAPEYSELAAIIPGIEVVAFRRKGFVAMFQVVRWLLGRRFRTVFDLQGSTRSRIMTLLTQANRRIGKRKDNAYTDVPTDPDDTGHAFQCMNALLGVAGIAPVASDDLPALRARSNPAVSAWLEKNALGEKKLVLMHAGSSKRWPSKRWEAGNFIELANQLEARGFSVIWLGGEDDRDLNRRLSSVVGVDASGLFSYTDIIALGRHAAFAVTNDSGPMHLLALSGIPVYAFFGPTDWRRSHAIGQQEHVLLNPVPCSPCHLKVCPPEYQHECLAENTPEMVVARMDVD